MMLRIGFLHSFGMVCPPAMHNVRPVSRLRFREIRIQTAVKAMEKDGISLAEAAKRVGYSPNHLRRLLDEERPIVQEI